MLPVISDLFCLLYGLMLIWRALLDGGCQWGEGRGGLERLIYIRLSPDFDTLGEI